ncbi:FadR/GntR family transcriptional regulator [uncultured Mailhella sp.]|uniref:FadR/GntR family transcriptional regulator n=1 Tax=uncultured Mailhella sp. TaxID=1981031 RepID=UPI0025E14A3F|nr:FadR/GntR family transcriptional regulator [uncultured Mailhella sp.]
MKKTERLSDRVAESILSMITVDRTLKPGDKLPNELELASQLGVSRITLREGIRMLAARNVLEIRRGRGTYVREDFKERSFRELHDVPAAEGSAESVYEMRMIFEPEVAYYATLRATESEMMHICELAKRIASGDPEDPRLLEDEKTFHRAIARATHNEFMNRLMPVLQEAFEQAMDLAPRHPEALHRSRYDHQLILDFMVSRNAEGARSAMKIHILHIMDALNLTPTRLGE